MPAKGTAHAGIELIPGRLQWEALEWATGPLAVEKMTSSHSTTSEQRP